MGHEASGTHVAGPVHRQRVGPQSEEQVALVSEPAQQPSPQTSMGQSAGQLHLVSPGASQNPLVLHTQSAGQLTGVSHGGSQTVLLLQLKGHSPGQLAQVSAGGSQVPLLSHTGQSAQVRSSQRGGNDSQMSLLLHPSGGQSSGQMAQSSPGLHTVLGQPTQSTGALAVQVAWSG